MNNEAEVKETASAQIIFKIKNQKMNSKEKDGIFFM